MHEPRTIARMHAPEPRARTELPWLNEAARDPADEWRSQLLAGILPRVRWGVVATLFLFALIQPLPGRVGAPTWGLILVFAGYNLLLTLAVRYLYHQPAPTLVSLLDLPVVALAYALGATPVGPVSILWLLIVGCAAVTLSLRFGLFYTLAAVLTILVITPTLPLWGNRSEDARELGAQVVVLVMVGTGTALLSRQIALERLAARESRKSALQLAEIDELRQNFIATISHELRTPLTAVRGGLGLLETRVSDRLQDSERRLLANVRRNIDRLDRQIGDLLALNQIQAGALQLEREELDARSVVSDTLATITPLMEQKQQTLELDLPEPLPLAGDRWRLEQVIVNLLCNAHEHTPAGTRICLGGRAEGDHIRLDVRDDGPGFPPGAEERIFEQFQRLDNQGNSGLGLAIARGIVELHGGRIWAENAEEHGAVFHVILPMGSQER